MSGVWGARPVCTRAGHRPLRPIFPPRRTAPLPCPLSARVPAAPSRSRLSCPVSIARLILSNGHTMGGCCRKTSTSEAVSCPVSVTQEPRCIRISLRAAKLLGGIGGSPAFCSLLCAKLTPSGFHYPMLSSRPIQSPIFIVIRFGNEISTLSSVISPNR